MNYAHSARFKECCNGSRILCSGLDMRLRRSISGRAKNWQKVAYLRRNPSPSVKWKMIA